VLGDLRECQKIQCDLISCALNSLETQKDYCFLDYATTLGDASVCSQIANESIRQECSEWTVHKSG
jgi:hypothetical protein